jgi:hypothetical protein
MRSTTLAGKTSRQELGDDLILRRSTQADAQALSDFNARIHGSEDTRGLNSRLVGPSWSEPCPSIASAVWLEPNLRWSTNGAPSAAS